FAFTVARGSSDHAASYAAWLIQSRLGLITASLPPSLWTRAGAELRIERALALAISQSGRGPDVVATTGMARERGALTLALVNDQDSPLAAAAEHVLPLRAGSERGVAATKTVLATLALAARLVGRWAPDEAFEAKVARLPEAVGQAQRLAWGAALVAHLESARACFVISRGPGLAIAQEIALKLQEVAGLPAIAFSSAEFQHGPKALLGPGRPALFLPVTGWVGDEADRLREDAGEAPESLAVVGESAGLEAPSPLDPALDPILLLAAAHPAIEAVARARGHDPDDPPRLEKVTRTL
ncbi:MAG: SIS domain-containing protein, partial [Geminicoccaceae bacterium]|nr:SIS domain-containing protein [Geminicoccaceae bacterium]